MEDLFFISGNLQNSCTLYKRFDIQRKRLAPLGSKPNADQEASAFGKKWTRDNLLFFEKVKLNQVLR